MNETHLHVQYNFSSPNRIAVEIFWDPRLSEIGGGIIHSVCRD